MIFSVLATVAALYLGYAAARNRLLYIERAMPFSTPERRKRIIVNIVVTAVCVVLLLIAIWSCVG